MDLHAILLLLSVLCSHLVGHNGVEGRMSLSEKEDLELENQLKHLNKPAIKTIHTDYGNIYDCIDFYKQPAFDHPLLKSHSFHFQMKPSSLLKRTRGQVSSNDSKHIQMGLKGIGCPVGTVPIRRTTKEDLIRERLASNIMPLTDDTPDANYAIVRTKVGPNKYSGVGAVLSLNNPHAVGNQNSAARFMIQNGPDSIQAGWRVDPSLYGDSRTRLFIYFNAGQSHCFNTRCPGFVIVNSNLPLDYVFDHISQPEGPWFETEIYIIHDQANGNWWLEIGPNNTQVGFWPKTIFSGLADLASYAEWGGEVFSPPGTPKPPMGSGHQPIFDPRTDSYFKQIQVLNADGKTADPNNIETFSDSDGVFLVWDDGFLGGDYGHLILYGGLGGST